MTFYRIYFLQSFNIYDHLMSDTEWDLDLSRNIIKSRKLIETYNDEEMVDQIKDNWDDEEDENLISQIISNNHINNDDLTQNILIKNLSHPSANEDVSHKGNSLDNIRSNDTHQTISLKELTPEEKIAERLRLQKLQEEDDLLLAKEMFGNENICRIEQPPISIISTNSQISSQSSDHMANDIDSIIKSITKLPKNTRQDFENLAHNLKTLLETVKDSSHFHFLAEEIIRYFCQQISATEVKKLSIMMDTLSQEKLKSRQGKKKIIQQTTIPAASKSKRPSLKKTSDKDYDSFMPPDEDEYDMF
ncbi:eukaryotic translation initiation factor 3 subunit J-like isoform X2 [Gordionus sp. m RMFG-2023]|uniref:eukaryotic translation initiation factor 3 subunit J-like isoform X2 n=1 Tax=Gordionus sp. m RMFG-2023 TaxID=3053472 RepID=UPI0031FBEFF2